MEDGDLLEKLHHPECKNYGFNMLVRKYQQKVYWHIRKMVIDHDDADEPYGSLHQGLQKHRYLPGGFAAIHLDLPHRDKRMPELFAAEEKTILPSGKRSSIGDAGPVGAYGGGIGG